MAPGKELPLLPSGYVAQPAWGFRDATGRFFYQFDRVYGLPTRSDARRSTTGLDEDLSYWVVTWWDERPTAKWMSYAQARERMGDGLTFEHFSSLAKMRPELPRLLDSGEAGGGTGR